MGRRRKQRAEEHVNHERWLVSYADFITLLFAFFVVMYSISSVNQGKYRVLSDSITVAFTEEQSKSFDVLQVGKPTQGGSGLLPDGQVLVLKGIKKTNSSFRPLEDMSVDISKRLKKWVNTGEVSIQGNDKWLEVEVNSSVLFKSGNATLGDEAKVIIRQLAVVLSNTTNHVYVAGYTDNIPIRTRVYPSNWELSAARAVSVVRLFADSGINPIRLGAVGFGEQRPLADNSLEGGRNKNRRISIRIFAGEDVFKETEEDADNNNSAQQLPVNNTNPVNNSGGVAQ